MSFLLVGFGQSIVYLRHIVKECSLASGNVRQLAAGLKKEMQIDGEIPILQSNRTWIPFTMGIRDKKIILPQMDLTENEWEMIVRHELIHCVRQDVFFKILMSFVRKIHWFNPLLILYQWKFNEISEYACDRTVVKKYDEKKRREYASLLLKIAKDRPPQKFTSGFSGRNVNILKKRMEYIMRAKNTEKKAAATMTAIVCALLCPTVTYAAAFGAELLQNSIYLRYDESRSVMLPSVEFDSLIKVDNSGSIFDEAEEVEKLNARGMTNVDTTISGNGAKQLGSVLVNADANIRVVIFSERESDNFRIGVIAPGGSKYYVNSKEGAVSKTFKIDRQGTYTVYAEGRNGSDGSRIHITGAIYVNN